MASSDGAAVPEFLTCGGPGADAVCVAGEGGIVVEVIALIDGCFEDATLWGLC